MPPHLNGEIPFIFLRKISNRAPEEIIVTSETALSVHTTEGRRTPRNYLTLSGVAGSPTAEDRLVESTLGSDKLLKRIANANNALVCFCHGVVATDGSTS